ncbi:MAG: hypothetical protein JWL85_648 [Candidatus Saccharibacteria bacterium]|nr:hypothetical protein [Candidatus Saccharibacteria bacterium]
MLYKMKGFISLGLILFAAVPATSNYQLNSFTFGSGGSANSSTATYALEGSAGELSGGTGSTANYSAKPGFIETQQAQVPKIATLSNNSGQYYNKLQFIIDQQGNPSDALYALAISTDNFVADTRYVKSDFTVGNTLTLADYKTYAAWGGASGANVIGLTSGITYHLKAKATQGKFTESAFGPSLSATTASPSITFSVTTSAQPTPPFSINFGSLLTGSVVTAAQTINLGIDSNAASGVHVYLTGKNGGLLSAGAGHTIASSSTDLSVAAEGYGIRSSSVSQTSGGPLTAQAPYNVSNDNVGLIDTTSRSLYSSGAPLVGGVATLLLKAKASPNAPQGNDYNDVLTFVASGSF